MPALPKTRTELSEHEQMKRLLLDLADRINVLSADIKELRWQVVRLMDWNGGTPLIPRDDEIPF